MAKLMICDFCEETPAAMVVTSIDNGDVHAFCVYCLYPFAFELTKNLPEGPELIAQMAQAQAEADAPPRPSRGRKKPQDAPPEAEPEGDAEAEPSQPVLAESEAPDES